MNRLGSAARWIVDAHRALADDFARHLAAVFGAARGVPLPTLGNLRLRWRRHRLTRKRMRWTVEVTGLRYTRLWVVGFRPGEWWIGARRDMQRDWWEFGVLGLTLCRPDERAPRNRPAPTVVRYVPSGEDRCHDCGDTNYSKTRLCLTCAYPDDPCSMPPREAVR